MQDSTVSFDVPSQFESTEVPIYFTSEDNSPSYAHIDVFVNKDLAKQYQVSYPTLRIRLDRLINKINIADDSDAENPFLLKIRLMVAEGTLTQTAAKALINAYEESK